MSRPTPAPPAKRDYRRTISADCPQALNRRIVIFVSEDIALRLKIAALSNQTHMGAIISELTSKVLPEVTGGF